MHATIDTVGNVTNYEYDNLGQMISETLPDPDGNGSQVAATTTYSYDANGNLLSVTDALANANAYGPDALADDKLVAHWKLDGNTDNAKYLLAEPVLAPNDLTPEWADGRFGQSLSFDADEGGEDDDHVDITGLDVNLLADEYNTVSFWMKWDGGNAEIPFSWNASSGGYYNLYFWDLLGWEDRGICFGFNTGNGDVLGISAEGLKDRWVHVTAAFCNVSVGDSILYIDGEKMPLEQLRRDPLSRSVTGTARLSGWNVTSGNTLDFGGLIDDLRIYKGELTENEVAAAALLGTTRFEYDSLGRVIREIGSPIAKGGDTFSYPTVAYEYDTAGNVISTTDELNRTTVYEYDKLNRLQKTTMPDPDGATANDQPISYYGYDKAGNLLWETDPLGSAPDPATGEPENGNPNTEHTTFYRYDALHRQTHVLDALSDNLPSNPSHATETAYDKAGNVTSVKDAEDNVTEYQYDYLNRLDKEIDPSLAEREYSYDKEGRLVQHQDRNGLITTYTYDAVGRLTDENWYNDGEMPGTHNPAHIISTEYDALGQVIKISETESGIDVAATYEYFYDQAGRVASTTAKIHPGTDTYIFDYRYDTAGNLIQIIDSFGGQTDYAFNPMGLLDWVSQSGSDVIGKSVDFEYKDNGQIETVTRRNNHILGGTYGYDGLDRLMALTHNDGAATPSLAAYNYQYDVASRIEDINIDYTNDAYDFHRYFGYDNIDQLLSAEHDGVDEESYTYEDNGSRNTANGADYDSALGNTNRIKSDGIFHYSYDAEGNRTERFIWTDVTGGEGEGVIDPTEKSSITEYEWDHRNRLTKVTERASVGATASNIVDYIYDAMDRRIATLVDSHSDSDSYADGTPDEYNYSLFQGDELFLNLTDTDGLGTGSNTTVARRYLYGQNIDEILAVEDEIADELYWTLADHQGSVRDAAHYDADSEVTKHVLHREFDSFGNFTSDYPEVVSAATVIIPQAYTGRLYDENTGLYDYRARWFDPVTGGFISEDPLAFGGGDANLYRYCGNSPTNYIDPSGQSWLSKWYKEAEDAVDHWADEVTETYLHTIREIEEENRNFWHNPSKYLEDNWKDGDLLTAFSVVSMGFAAWTYGPMLLQNITSTSLGFPDCSFVSDWLFNSTGTWQFQPGVDMASTLSSTASGGGTAAASGGGGAVLGGGGGAVASGSGGAIAGGGGGAVLGSGGGAVVGGGSAAALGGSGVLEYSALLLDPLFFVVSGTNALKAGAALGITFGTIYLDKLINGKPDRDNNTQEPQVIHTQEPQVTTADTRIPYQPANASSKLNNYSAMDFQIPASANTTQQNAVNLYDDFLSQSPSLARANRDLAQARNGYKNSWGWSSSPKE